MRFEDTRFECGLRLPKALRAWFVCRTRFEDTWFKCGLRLPKALRAWFECHTRFEMYTAPPLCGSSLPNQPRDNVTPLHTLWDNCRTRFEDTRFEYGLRLPKALRTWFECRTRFETYTAPVYPTNQEIMSHPYIHFGNVLGTLGTRCTWYLNYLWDLL